MSLKTLTAQFHAGKLVHELGHRDELAHGGAVGFEKDDWIFEGLFVFIGVILVGSNAGTFGLFDRFGCTVPFVPLLSILVFDLVQFLYRLDPVKVTLYSGLFPVNLEEWEAVIAVGLCGYGRRRGRLPRDLLEHVRVEDLDVEADCVVSLPDRGGVGVL